MLAVSDSAIFEQNERDNVTVGLRIAQLVHASATSLSCRTARQ